MDQPTFDAKVKWVMKNQGKDEESARKIVGAAVRDHDEIKEGEASDPYGYETAAAAEREAYKKGPPQPRSNKTVAGTQNLDWLDPESPDPEAEFFGQKIDPDDVGTQTMHFTPDQLKRLRELMRRQK